MQRNFLRKVCEILKSLPLGLRTLALAYRPLELDHAQQAKMGDMLDMCENHLVLIGIVGIEDPIRPEVPRAIQLCKNAGIVVRMVTGDSMMSCACHNIL